MMFGEECGDFVGGGGRKDKIIPHFKSVKEHITAEGFERNKTISEPLGMFFCDGS